ncbi:MULTISPECIES: L-rhamnose mutarotase [unclassified Streptomyces]|uniref:L-rhamnose mutarotase n=1 Tax=unclassified Streptomyces TaxID=2593676 RepID=UPI00225B5AB0|nr:MULTISPECIES: L-rhamnose mutarotase [unclassified Streptomyces]MCX5145026.1 L-rhamnose mutarotase [Streptomyces sp. NBC_00338]WRZ62727.1 L-rhamnose mutarotase [Streptomyces sp. NBC_01257]WSU56693.1 L-rhamnose mutarotase [Streptomyces sp. NBC_01104]
MKRVAQVIRVRPERLDEYRDLHRRVPQPVLDRLRASHIANYSIHLLGDRLFAYFEYHGDDLAADLALMAADDATQAWWRLTDPCQEPVPEAAPGEHWASMEQVFLME